MASSSSRRDPASAVRRIASMQASRTALRAAIAMVWTITGGGIRRKAESNLCSARWG
jgi:hypothetical protein